jgi:uncharacterized protein with von Willebrand factor type A (vWA) domain
MRKEDIFSKYTIENDLYDTVHFESIKEEAQNIKEVEEKHRKKLKEIAYLSQDFYSALYKAAPTPINERLIDPQLEIHKEVVKMLLEHPEYEKLRNFTFLDEFAAAIGLVPLLDEIVSSLPDPPPEPKEGDGNGNGEGEGEGDQKGKKKRKPGRPRLNDKQKEALKEAIQKGCKQSGKDINDAASCMTGWGTDPGEIQKLPFKEKFALRERLAKSEKMRQLSRMVGRACHLALSSQKTKVKHGSDEVYDVDMGSDLSRVLPAEKMLLHGGKASQLDFKRRFSEGKLMQYKLRSVLKEQKGPIVCCIDNSGSMCGNPELWSKAFGLGLLEIAIKQRRKLVILHFGSESELKRFDFSSGDAPMERKIECAEFFFGGGTDFESPLNASKKIVTEELPKADVIMITDGVCDVKDKWLKDWDKWRKEKGVKCYSVYVEEGAESPPEILEKLSDMVVHAADLERGGTQYQQQLYEAL